MSIKDSDIALIKDSDIDALMKGDKNTIKAYKEIIFTVRDQNLRKLIFEKLALYKDNSYAQYILAYMHFYGVGTVQDNIEAFKLAQQSAEQGNMDTQNMLGDMYRYGRGTDINMPEAFKCYKLGMDIGNAERLNDLADLYNDQGTKLNIQEAFKLYKLSADMGNSHAQACLADIYLKGRGVPKNRNEAFRLNKLSADQNNNHGRNNLADMYFNGLEPNAGTIRNYNEAFRLYKLSADDDDEAYALSRLSLMYSTGCGTTQDYKMAFKCLKQSADQFNDNNVLVEDNFKDLLKDNATNIIDFITNLISENEELKRQKDEANEVIAHLKLYPGQDYEEAMNDYNLLSKSESISDTNN